MPPVQVPVVGRAQNRRRGFRGFAEYTSVTSRMDSFNGTAVAQKVPAGRLARGGFFYKGPGDKVQCFSCRKIVSHWNVGDLPVEKHRAVSPKCTFLRCIYPVGSRQINGEYNEEEEDLDYRLRTGAVVDETPTYPKVPHMKSEATRLESYRKWPTSSHMRPCDLARAGLFYVGKNDHVQCFCCGGMMGAWEPGDTAWGEHEKHYSSCLFVLGHDVGNVPIQSGSHEEERSRRNQIAADPEVLAKAGFYSTGTGDKVMCFCCGGGLKGWQPGEDPWEEHAKNYPGCRFLLTAKGEEFVNNVQLQNRGATNSQNGFSKGGEENTSSEQKDEDPMTRLERLKREKQCKICMDRDISGFLARLEKTIISYDSTTAVFSNKFPKLHATSSVVFILKIASQL
ncbi:hypothetical protein WMY93_009437 [Mugilogobius chulae]|uniref:RING-type E3 ubiquitin transferase n=1 Tax=Mugilogobius chulae TaxID=88201 RepID=A0AAW0PM60_9GOBI